MLRAAVIGVGAMGAHHARVYNELEDVELAAVADTERARAEAVARRFKVPSYADYRTMLNRERPHLVSVAVPTSLHHAVSLDV
ncbi:MAG: Gfo/Idh/MocA family oxidoreductase, partial [Chloroflexia bacterium]